MVGNDLHQRIHSFSGVLHFRAPERIEREEELKRDGLMASFVRGRVKGSDGSYHILAEKRLGSTGVTEKMLAVVNFMLYFAIRP